MDLRQRTKRFGLYVILWAFVLRLAADGIPQKGLIWLLQDPVPFHIHEETGRNVRFSASSNVFSSHFRESPPPWFPEPTKKLFSSEDAQLLELYNTSAKMPDPEALLRQPLDWDLSGSEPTVLILHTHTTESYTPAEEPYHPVSSYRTLDEAYNMLSIGSTVAEILEKNGIGVVHDREVHDYPSYNGSYTHARKAISGYLEQNPSILLILDLHRDAAGTSGKQLRTEVLTADGVSAQLMLVQGTNFDTWENNLSLAAKLHVQLEQQSPGIMRPLNVRSQRFNQDLCPGALLVEIGAAGNTRKEALAAARELAEAIVALSRGSTTDTDG